MAKRCAADALMSLSSPQDDKTPMKKARDVSGVAGKQPLAARAYSVDGTMSTVDLPSGAASISGFSDDGGPARDPSPVHRTPSALEKHANSALPKSVRPLADLRAEGDSMHDACPPPSAIDLQMTASDLQLEQQHDARLLTACSVYLAACGVQHALSTLADTGLTSRVTQILRDECLRVDPLDKGSFARLCHILTLPLEVGAAWQARVMALQRRFAHAGPSVASVELPGECAAAAAAAAFYGAVNTQSLYTSAVRRFGRQTVWCTVMLLRRVLREAQWAEGDRALSEEQAEAQLASMAVQLIGRNMVASVATGW